ncbi:MAG: STAS/SEC14 domain-containing protein, partial [Cyclobacteriaceae bacterium]|nr:STAS/SEC14 domain-containing protein [Cyclobacteriaceae bacterium]
MKKDFVKTRTAKIWKDEDGIIHTELDKSSELTLEDGIENINVIEKMNQGSSVLVLSDIRNVKSVSKEHRDFFSSERVVKIMSAGAIITGSPITKVMANFFFQVNKPPYRTKMFTSETEAIKWLKEHAIKT